jgi:hypothetical protein
VSQTDTPSFVDANLPPSRELADRLKGNDVPFAHPTTKGGIQNMAAKKKVAKKKAGKKR